MITAYQRKLEKQRADERPRLENILGRAVLFTATIFVRGGYITHECKTLDDARAQRAGLESQAGNGRKPLIYAVTPDRFTHLIPDWFNPGEKQ